MRVLVVEDDVDLNRQLCEALQEADYVIDKAFDGEEGHFLGDTEPYDAVVLDIGLPRMDGLSVLERWRRAQLAQAFNLVRDRHVVRPVQRARAQILVGLVQVAVARHENTVAILEEGARVH